MATEETVLNNLSLLGPQPCSFAQLGKTQAFLDLSIGLTNKYWFKSFHFPNIHEPLPESMLTATDEKMGQTLFSPLRKMLSNRHVDTVGEGEGEANWESSTYTLPGIKQIARRMLLCSTGSSARCSVMT